MHTLADILKQWAMDDGAKDPVISIDDKGLGCEYAFECSADDLTFMAYLNGYERERIVVLSLYFNDEAVSEDRRSAVALSLSMLNDGYLREGNFELSPRGRVRYRNAIHVSGDTLDGQRVHAVIGRGMDLFVMALPVIHQVAFAKVSPESAFATLGNEGGGISIVDAGNADAPPWRHFPGSEAIQRWAKSVSTALAESDTSDATWRMIGPAIGIEHRFLRVGESLARRLAHECGIPLHVVTVEDLPQLNGNLFALERTAPILIYLEAGIWQNRKGDANNDDPEGLSRVLTLLRAFNPAHPVLVMTMHQDVTEMATTLRRQQAFDRWFELPEMTSRELGEIFIEMVGMDRCAPSVRDNPGKVGKLLDRDFDAPEARKLGVLRAQRMHRETGRPIEFIDLLDMNNQGILERSSRSFEDMAMRERVAWHEAGHAAMEAIDSMGKFIPEFTSILPKGNFDGVVVSSLEFTYARSRHGTYADFCHSIRVFLAGRAAEELAYGTAHIGNGCHADLESAFRLATRAFMDWGYTPGMEHPDSDSASNLAVVLGKPSPSEYERTETLVRDYLAEQYRHVLGQLRTHRALLDALQSRLIEVAVLDQQEVAQLYARFTTAAGGGDDVRNS